MNHSTYYYAIEGTDAAGNTWVTLGSVEGEFMDCLTLAFRDSFQQLTRGKAIFGNPGVGCRGPYTICKYQLTNAATELPDVAGPYCPETRAPCLNMCVSICNIRADQRARAQ